MKTKHTKELNIFRFKFILMILMIDFIAVLLVYFIMPLVQNFPPLSENFDFQREVQKVTHVQQYLIVFVAGVSIHLITFKLLMQNIYSYIDKFYRKEKISFSEIRSVREDCINIPYKVFFVQMVLIISLGILFNFIMLVSMFAILKFTLMIVAVASIVSIVLLIGAQKLLYNVILLTYKNTEKYENHIGYRITNSQNLLFQMVPLIAVILIVISLIGYTKTVQQEGFSTGNYYKAYLQAKNITTEQVELSSLNNILNSIPLQSNDHYYFIIAPNDEYSYISNPQGRISDFVYKYRDYFYSQTNGFLYEKFGVDEQLYAMNLQDKNGDTWYIGFKYSVIDMDLLSYYLAVITFILFIYTILLYIWSHNISNNLIKTTDSLKNILDTENVENAKPLPIVSNDEFADLAYYYNKIQELTIDNIKQINDNQETLMEKERLASLGQLIGGIAHNLKTPIMSISGAAEGLNDLISEYNSSIGDPEVNNDDHHEIAADMSEWVKKIKSYTEYMSDVITAVKGQAVALSTEENISFTIDELIKRVDILMKHELKHAMIYLNIDLKTSEDIIIHGDVNSLVQVINNMISNAIQAYDGKQNETIDLIIEKVNNKISISIKDYAGGLPKKVKDKLFKEMITTKGKNGTGLGLYISYSTIKANFKGTIKVSSKDKEGTTFSIIIPLKK